MFTIEAPRQMKPAKSRSVLVRLSPEVAKEFNVIAARTSIGKQKLAERMIEHCLNDLKAQVQKSR